MILDIPAVPMMVAADKQNIDMIISYLYNLLAYLSSVVVVTPTELTDTLNTTLATYVTDAELISILGSYSTTEQMNTAIADAIADIPIPELADSVFDAGIIVAGH
jgi:hypothetical protein